MTKPRASWNVRPDITATCVYVCVYIYCVHIYMSMQTVSTSSLLLAPAAALGCNLVRDTGISNWAENSLVFTTRSLCAAPSTKSKVSHLPTWIYIIILAKRMKNILEYFSSGVMCLFVQTLKPNQNVSPRPLYRGFEWSNLFLTFLHGTVKILKTDLTHFP